MASNTSAFGHAEVVSAGRPIYPFVKRVLDVVLCLLMLPLALVAMAAIALAVILDSPGPAFFIQERVGRGGRPFRMFKFRTLSHGYDSKASRKFMAAFVNGQVGADDSPDRQRVFKPLDHKDITRVGRVLRRTSLDELPQIVNVLLGQMSLVGPRPNVQWEVEAYQDWHRKRLDVLPGITGLAQICGRSEISFDAIVRYDIEYIRNQSLKTDCQILWQTVTSVLSGRGAG